MVVIAAPLLSWKYRSISIFPARLAVSSLEKSAMCKGILIALLALLLLRMYDRCLSDGRYTAAAIAMTKQIGRAYGI